METYPKINLQYFSQLDGLRGLAIILVIFFHWNGVLWHLPFGWVGVQVFFMLSGFLITRILISAKKESFKSYILHFYKRRALRIFPLYYTFLLLCLIFFYFLNNQLELHPFTNELERNWFFLLSYTYNFQEFFHGILSGNYWPTLFFSNLWSLSVEEQFYLIFPFVVFFLPQHKLKWLLLFLIILTPVLRIITLPILVKLHSLEWAGFIQYRLLPFHSDTIAIGALLAICDFSFIKKPIVWLNSSLIVVLIFGIYYVTNNYDNTLKMIKSLGFGTPVDFVQDGRYLYAFTILQACSFFLILHILKGGKILLFDNKLLRYIGKISYGIYIFHGPVLIPFFIALGIFKTNNFLLRSVYETLILLVYLLCVLFISHISYKYFESWFLKLK